MSRDPILVLTMIGAMLTPAVVGAATWGLLHNDAEIQAKQTAAIEALRRQVEQSQSAQWVDARSTAHNCYADNSNVSCTITNPGTEAITTCIVGKLKQKKASGVSLSSLVMCTGRLGPRETRNVSSPWTGGFARDICNSADRWGNEVLDWAACSFDVEGVGLPAIELMSKAGK
jgi:hypothetical protein